MLDPDLIAFLRSSVPSIWALELLLLLRRAAPGGLTQAELVQHLRATPELIDRLVAEFARGGLVTKSADGTIRFDCSSTGLADVCEKLAVAADQRPIALRDAIISLPNAKLRDFSDAFRLKGKDE